MKTRNIQGDPTPVLGGAPLPEDIDHPEIPDDLAVPNDELSSMLFMLMRLHADTLTLNFRDSDIKGMNEETKRHLINDIHEALSIRTDFGDIL